MNTFICILLLGSLVAAEPPRFRSARFRSEKQEVGRPTFEEREPTTPNNEGAPYAPAGFRPTKEFNLPSRNEAPPATSYGVPADSYGTPLHTYTAPQVEYGVPEPRKSKEENEDGEEVESLKVEGLKSEGKKQKFEVEPKNDAEVVEGVYYVLLPDSQLQRVQFQTENDIRNMAYTARLQYRSEDRAPVFVYSSAPQYQTAAYMQLPVYKK